MSTIPLRLMYWSAKVIYWLLPIFYHVLRIALFLGFLLIGFILLVIIL